MSEYHRHVWIEDYNPDYKFCALCPAWEYVGPRRVRNHELDCGPVLPPERAYTADGGADRLAVRRAGTANTNP